MFLMFSCYSHIPIELYMPLISFGHILMHFFASGSPNIGPVGVIRWIDGTLWNQQHIYLENYMNPGPAFYTNLYHPFCQSQGIIACVNHLLRCHFYCPHWSWHMTWDPQYHCVAIPFISHFPHFTSSFPTDTLATHVCASSFHMAKSHIWFKPKLGVDPP